MMHTATTLCQQEPPPHSTDAPHARDTGSSRASALSDMADATCDGPNIVQKFCEYSDALICVLDELPVASSVAFLCIGPWTKQSGLTILSYLGKRLFVDFEQAVNSDNGSAEKIKISLRPEIRYRVPHWILTVRHESAAVGADMPTDAATVTVCLGSFAEVSRFMWKTDYRGYLAVDYIVKKMANAPGDAPFESVADSVAPITNTAFKVHFNWASVSPLYGAHEKIHTRAVSQVMSVQHTRRKRTRFNAEGHLRLYLELQGALCRKRKTPGTPPLPVDGRLYLCDSHCSPFVTTCSLSLAPNSIRDSHRVLLSGLIKMNSVLFPPEVVRLLSSFALETALQRAREYQGDEQQRAVVTKQGQLERSIVNSRDNAVLSPPHMQGRLNYDVDGGFKSLGTVI